MSDIQKARVTWYLIGVGVGIFTSMILRSNVVRHVHYLVMDGEEGGTVTPIREGKKDAAT